MERKEHTQHLTPAAALEADRTATESLSAWQVQVAQSLMKVLSVGAVPVLLYFSPSMLERHFWGAFIFGWVATPTCLWLAWSTLPRVRRLQPWFVVLAVAFPTEIVMLSTGYTGSGATNVMASLGLSTLLLGLRAGVGVAAVMCTTMAVCALGYGQGWLPLSTWPVIPPQDPLHWINAALSMLSLGGCFVLSLHFLLRKLASALDRSRDLVATLKAEMAEGERAHQALIQTQLQLVHAQKTELMAAVAAGLAHDMNNALTVILGEGELLAMDSQQETSPIIDAAQHAAQMTRQLLSFGRRDLSQPRVLDLRAAVARCANALRRIIPSDIKVDPPVGGDPIPVRADFNQLQQVVFNLGVNARDAMPSGGRLSFELRAAPEHATLLISDTGHGIPQHILAHIFDAFFTTKPDGVGTGLGLSVVKDLVERMGGQISVDSQQGHGTTFSITLPLSTQPLDDLPASSASSTTSESIVSGATILVVDDDVRVRALVCTMLSHAGYTVLDASNAPNAIHTLETQGHAIDLVWTDVVMPQQGARALLDWIQTNQPPCAVLICSGYADDDLVRRDIERGTWPILPKPFTRQQALQAVRQAILLRRFAL